MPHGIIWYIDVSISFFELFHGELHAYQLSNCGVELSLLHQILSQSLDYPRGYCGKVIHLAYYPF